MAFSQPGGLRLERKKDASLLNWNLKRPYPPEKLRMAVPAGSSLCVRDGEAVKTGQKLAEPANPGGVTVHAGLTGTVKSATTLPDATGRKSLTIEIQKSGDPKPASGVGEARKEWEQIPAEGLLEIFQRFGLVTTDAIAEPVHAKIKRYPAAKTLIMNGCEPEPYVTCEQVLFMSHPVEILKGAELLRKAAGAEKILFVFEACDSEMRELIKSKIFFLKWNHVEVRTVVALYPQGVESVLLQHWFAGQEDQAVVFPVSTAFAAYEAVALQKPFYERVVTVGGECVVEPRSLWLPLGISFQDAIHACKGVMREPQKVVMGGPMTGIAQAHWDVSVMAGTTAILALPKEVAKEDPEEPCIRCNRCVDQCPVRISPALITLAADQGEREVAKALGVSACIACGNCGYVCPSKRPMLERIRRVRDE